MCRPRPRIGGRGRCPLRPSTSRRTSRSRSPGHTLVTPRTIALANARDGSSVVDCARRRAHLIPLQRAHTGPLEPHRARRQARPPHSTPTHSTPTPLRSTRATHRLSTRHACPPRSATSPRHSAASAHAPTSPRPHHDVLAPRRRTARGCRPGAAGSGGRSAWREGTRPTRRARRRSGRPRRSFEELRRSCARASRSFADLARGLRVTAQILTPLEEPAREMLAIFFDLM